MLVAEVHRREASLRRAVQERLTADERAALLDACTLLDRVGESLQARAAAPARQPRASRADVNAARRASP
jgi:hypothetical protein